MDTNNELMLITTNLRRMIDQGTTKAMGIPDIEIQNALLNYKKQYQERLDAGYGHADIIKGFYRTMEEIYKNYIPEVYKSKISCSKGCAHCCHINVDCSQGEIDIIMRYCKHNKIEIDLKRLVIQSAMNVEQRPLSSKSACVFLAEDNTCKIYNARPLACRKYFVVSPAVKCNYKENPQDEVHIYPVLQMELIASAIANMQPAGNMASGLLKTLMTNKF